MTLVLKIFGVIHTRASLFLTKKKYRDTEKMFKPNVNSSSNNSQPQPGLSYQTNVPLVPKTTKITDEYEISNQVLGLGIVRSRYSSDLN